jgi:hypothetical protein
MAVMTPCSAAKLSKPDVANARDYPYGDIKISIVRNVFKICLRRR